MIPLVLSPFDMLNWSSSGRILLQKPTFTGENGATKMVMEMPSYKVGDGLACDCVLGHNVLETVEDLWIGMREGLGGGLFWWL